MVYSYDAKRDLENHGYNILRHVGSTYALLESFELHCAGPKELYTRHAFKIAEAIMAAQLADQSNPIGTEVITFRRNPPPQPPAPKASAPPGA